MIALDKEEREIFLEYSREYLGWINSDLESRLRNSLDSVIPREVTDLQEKVGKFRKVINQRDTLGDLPNGRMDIPIEHGPVIKNILFFKRRQVARHLEPYISNAVNAEVIDGLKAKQELVEKYFNQQWFKKVKAIKHPVLSKFINVKSVEKYLSQTLNQVDRDYDEKFSILQSPRNFYPDLHFYLEKCRARDAGVCVAYLDIDDFKKYNSTHGETSVDKVMLPIFMNALEAHMFSHGYAYRYGGDEYVAIIPNMEADLAASFFKGLASRLMNLEYGHIKEKATVSIGLYSVPGDTIYTEKEIEFRANKAKNEAKKKGKNCIVIYRETDDGQEILEKVE